MFQLSPASSRPVPGFVAIGSNRPGQSRASRDIVKDAINAMHERDFNVTLQSRLYRSPAFPPGAGADFVNAVVAVETILDPEQLMERLHDLEAAFGRERNKRWGARTLDLDLLALGDAVLPGREVFSRWVGLPLEQQSKIAPDRLILPHPRLQDRAFVLVPLAEIAPAWRHPVLGRTAVEMRDALDPAECASVVPI